MAAYYSQQGKNLNDVLIDLYEEFGYYKEDLTSFTLQGKEGIEKIHHTIDYLRKEKITQFGSHTISRIRDYHDQEITIFDEQIRMEKINLPVSNVLYFETTDNSWFCVRPSGTEPKIKIYYGVNGSTLDNATERLVKLKKDVLSVLELLLFDKK
jgi:phosphoglucomutase